MESYYSNGKLLLTGEYLILHGAGSLAFPVQYGQSLQVKLQPNIDAITWDAYEPDGLWFFAEFETGSLNIVKSNSEGKAKYLRRILIEAQKLNNNFLKGVAGFQVKTTTNFPINWGLGTSSTLINNIALWAGADAFKLHRTVSKGSGYDIACAGSNSPILYKKFDDNVSIKPVRFNKAFLNNLYFVYSGNKMATENAVGNFYDRKGDFSPEVNAIDRITNEILKTNSINEFINLLKEHERVIGNVINKTPVGGDIFSDFKGVVKSLGAWGGDFYLAATRDNEKYVQGYFEQINLSVIIPFKKMVL